MYNVSISAKHLRNHLLELQSSNNVKYSLEERLQQKGITLFGLFFEIWGTICFTPVYLENRYYPERNIWVACIIPIAKRFDLEYFIPNTQEIEPGFDFDHILAFLGDNLEKPVYIYEQNTFYPFYKSDIVKWNGLLGFLEGYPNYLNESNDNKPLTGIQEALNLAQYCVTVFEYRTMNGYSDPDDMYRDKDYYYFNNLISAKLFYNQTVAKFMEQTPADYKTNFKDFSQSSLSWRGVRSHYTDVWIEDILSINLKKVKVSYETIEGEYELI